MSIGSLEIGAGPELVLKPFRPRRLVIDLPLLGTLLAISGIGFIVLYSAIGGDTALLIRQGVRVFVALMAFIVVSQIQPRTLKLWTPWLFFLGLGLLVLVLVNGTVGQGAQRWLDLGIVRFQPSELLKLAVPMMVAWFMHERRLPPTFLQLILVFFIIFTPAVMIARQPDLGTAILVIAAGGLAVMFAGVSVRVMSVFGVMGLVSAPMLWYFMRDYQRARVLTFLNPESDPLGAGYNIIQSKIALGSGGCSVRAG